MGWIDSYPGLPLVHVHHLSVLEIWDGLTFSVQCAVCSVSNSGMSVLEIWDGLTFSVQCAVCQTQACPCLKYE